MSKSSIELKYTLNPPSEASQPISSTTSTPVPVSDHLSFPLSVPLTPSTAEYYRIASESLRNFQNTLNELLTPWKDSIGDLEKSKEDLGKVAHGHGRAAMMSAKVNGEMKTLPAESVAGTGAEEESSEEEESD